MRIHEIINEDISRRGFLKGAGAAAVGMAGVSGAYAKGKNLNDPEVWYLVGFVDYGKKVSGGLSEEEDIEFEMILRLCNEMFFYYNKNQKAVEMYNAGQDAFRDRSKKFYSSEDLYRYNTTEYNKKVDEYRRKLTKFGFKKLMVRVNSPLEESVAVNMSPYKEAIQNAETSKQKSAKNKIGELTRK